jgi:hypothetical protein
MPPIKRPRQLKKVIYPEFELNIPYSHPKKKVNKDIIRYKPKFDLITLLDKYNKKTSDPARALKDHLKKNDGYFRKKYIDPINKTGETKTIENLTEYQKDRKQKNANYNHQKEIISNLDTIRKYSSQLHTNKKKIELYTTALFKILKEADVFKHRDFDPYKANLEKELVDIFAKISDFNTIGYDEFSRKLLHHFTYEYSTRCSHLINNPNFTRLNELIGWVKKLNPVLEKTVEYRMSRKIRSQLKIEFPEAK